MQKFQDVVLDSQGRPVAGAVIAVQAYPGGSPATVYETDAVGAAYTPTTDAFGAFFFYAPDGNYSYTVTVSGVLRKTVTDVQIVDAAPAASPTFTGNITLTAGQILGVANIGGYSNTGAYSIWGGQSVLDGSYIQLLGGSHATDANVLILGSDSNESARVDASRRFLIGITSANTSGAKLQTVDGITFPATQVASSDANTLDDYEEGTWTPVDESGAALSLTASDCVYTKIGRVVHVQGIITYPVTASGTGTRVGGLPFATRSGTRTAIEIGGYTDSSIDLAGYSVAANASFILYTRGTNTAVTNAQLSTFGFAVNATYEV